MAIIQLPGSEADDFFVSSLLLTQLSELAKYFFKKSEYYEEYGEEKVQQEYNDQENIHESLAELVHYYGRATMLVNLIGRISRQDKALVDMATFEKKVIIKSITYICDIALPRIQQLHQLKVSGYIEQLELISAQGKSDEVAIICFSQFLDHFGSIAVEVATKRMTDIDNVWELLFKHAIYPDQIKWVEKELCNRHLKWLDAKRFYSRKYADYKPTTTLAEYHLLLRQPQISQISQSGDPCLEGQADEQQKDTKQQTDLLHHSRVQHPQSPWKQECYKQSGQVRPQMQQIHRPRNNEQHPPQLSNNSIRRSQPVKLQPPLQQQSCRQEQQVKKPSHQKLNVKDVLEQLGLLKPLTMQRNKKEKHTVPDQPRKVKKHSDHFPEKDVQHIENTATVRQKISEHRQEVKSDSKVTKSRSELLFDRIAKEAELKVASKMNKPYQQHRKHEGRRSRSCI